MRTGVVDEDVQPAAVPTQPLPEVISKSTHRGLIGYV